MGKRKPAAPGIVIVPGGPTAPPGAATVEAQPPPPPLQPFEAAFVPGLDSPPVPGLDKPAPPPPPAPVQARPLPAVWQAELVLQLPEDIRAALEGAPEEAEQLAADLVQLLPPSITCEIAMYGGKLTMRLPESMHDLLREVYCGRENHRTRPENRPV